VTNPSKYTSVSAMVRRVTAPTGSDRLEEFIVATRCRCISPSRDYGMHTIAGRTTTQYLLSVDRSRFFCCLGLQSSPGAEIKVTYVRATRNGTDRAILHRETARWRHLFAREYFERGILVAQ
jgi:hypothetical protein